MNEGRSPLVQILEDHRGEIVATWAEMIHRLPDSHFRERPLEALHTSRMRALGAIIEALTTGSYAAVETFLTEVSLTHLRMGFDISEVIEALLLCKDATLPIIWGAFPPNSAAAREAIAQLDGCLRRMIGRFGQLYAEGMSRRLARQADRLRLVNAVGRQISAILNLDELLHSVVRLIRAAFDYYNVNIFLVEPKGSELVLRAGEGGYVDGKPPLGFRMRVGEGILGQVMATGQALLVSDVLGNAHYRRYEDLPDTRAELAVPIWQGERIIGTLDVQSTQRDAFDEEELFTLQILADQIAVAIANARLYESERERRRVADTLREVAEVVGSTLHLGEVLDLILEQLRRVVPCDSASVQLLAGDRLEVISATGFERPEEMVGISFPLSDEYPSKVVMHQGQPLVLPDAQAAYPIFRQKPYAHICSWLGVPLMVKDKAIGMITLERKELRAFGEDDIQLVAAFANQAALAVENARLYVQAQEVAALKERHRLARELHDSVAQAIYGATLYAEAAARLLEAGRIDVASEHLRGLRDTTQEALRDMRLFIFELRPPELERVGLVAALQARLKAVEERVGLEMEFKVEGEGRPPHEIEEGLYRIAQEALNNALKHAQAHKITVYLRQDERTVSLEVADDGVGFDPAAVSGMGLWSMAERAALMGGSLEIEGAAGKGSRVRVEVPR